MPRQNQAGLPPKGQETKLIVSLKLSKNKTLKIQIVVMISQVRMSKILARVTAQVMKASLVVLNLMKKLFVNKRDKNTKIGKRKRFKA